MAAAIGMPELVDALAQGGHDRGAGDWVEFSVEMDHAVACSPVAS
jgi:hypothetical protein